MAIEAFESGGGLRGDVDLAQEQRRRRRIAALYADDSQFSRARPNFDLVQAVQDPSVRLAAALSTLMRGYADRPAVGQRAYELVTDPVSMRTSMRLLPRFITVTYRTLWACVSAIASVWDRQSTHRVGAGDKVAAVGFASPEYLMIDLVCAYLGLVSAPISHTASASQLRSILIELEPQVLAVSAQYLGIAAEAAAELPSLRRLMIFDYDPKIDDHRDNVFVARSKFTAENVSITVETFRDTVERGRGLRLTSSYTQGTDGRLAMILYTSGSTGTPKGAMYTERMLKGLWTASWALSDTPVFNVNFMPLNHVAGRVPMVASLLAGGTCYFAGKSDLSTLFEDWQLVRPTQVAVVPRVIDMLFERYRRHVDRELVGGGDLASAEEKGRMELRDNVFGGRGLAGFTATAPLTSDMKSFIDSTFDVHFADLLGSTEAGLITRDNQIMRPPVIDYKLVDVPELGYFATDKPYPRGELLLRTEAATPGYYNRPEVTGNSFDADGYFRTGDVMAEVRPDYLYYVDRRNNVMKLAQGEFVAIAHLEAVFAATPLVDQIYIYGNSEHSNLLAVVVPTREAQDEFATNNDELKLGLARSLQEAAVSAELRSYELPVDFLVELEPFSASNGLLSNVGKNLPGKLKARYGDRLEQLYSDIAVARVDDKRTLIESAAHQPVINTLIRACALVIGAGQPSPDARFIDLGGDSLSALTLSTLLADIYGFEIPVGIIINPASDLQKLADYIEGLRTSPSTQTTFESVHGRNAATIYARDISIEAFVPATTVAGGTHLSADGAQDVEASRSIVKPYTALAANRPRIVLLTGANGWLGRFLALEWLERMADTDSKLITIVRARDDAQARARLESAFVSADHQLERRFRQVSASHLEVLAGDLGASGLGMARGTWERLVDDVDLIVHAGALVNHALPYGQLFGPNVVGTAEMIRLAITSKVKPINFISTVAVAMSMKSDQFQEDGDIRLMSPVRAIDSSYANGYANSKWAAEVLLREAHERYRLPVAVFRCDMILAHGRFPGQLNTVDLFTRLILSILATGVAPTSFYEVDAEGTRPRAHYDGLPVDFVAEAIATIGAQAVEGYHSLDVINPHDDAISLDTYVDWLIGLGHEIRRIDSYHEWLTRFKSTLIGLPEKLLRASVLPLLDAFSSPLTPTSGANVPTEHFQAAVRAAKVGGDAGIPHVTRELIAKYASDIDRLGLL